MARLSFRDRFFTPPVGRELSSPWSILVLGVVTAGAILAGAPIVVAGAIGAAVYAGKVAIKIPRNTKSERIEASVLKEPWRGYVQSAQAAKKRFDRTVESTRDGPLRERLQQLSSRLAEGIDESWKIACRGDDIDGAIAQLDTRQAHSELAQVQLQIREEGTSRELESTLQSLTAQLQSESRMKRVSSTTRDRLRLLDARFDELVARAVEVSVGAADSGVLGNDVNDLVNELEGLRLAMDDTRRAEQGDTGPGLPSAEPRPQSRPPQ